MKAKFAGYTVKLPRHPAARAVLGVLLVIGGMLGFLPVLGFWMIPLGLAVLAVDFPPVRRWYRRTTVQLGHLMHRKFPRFARYFGYGTPRSGKHQ
jgi:UPF0716 family protein affecting phage T7 exclusion